MNSNIPTIKIGQKWIDADDRNTETHGKNGRRLKQARFRTVEIVALPTLSSPGVMKVLTAPKAPHTVGKLREFTTHKLLNHYLPVGA